VASKIPKTPPRERVQFAAPDLSFERLPNGKLRYTHVPQPIETSVKWERWRPIYCAGYEVDQDGKKHYHHLERIPCHCDPGPQYQAINKSAFEIALLGGRGSAKSEATFGFLVKGNYPYCVNEENPTATDITYLNSQNYSFLVLRKNAKDLKSYKKRAERFFSQFGGFMTEDGVNFPSGAWGIFDHLADGDAWEKYQGQEFGRIVIEEANQIPDLDSYLRVLMSCRSSDTEIREQMMITLNPGGKGQRWTSERFYKIRKADGSRLLNGEIYRDPTIADDHRCKRTYIRSTVDDNPYQLAKGYDKQLDLLKSARPALWKRWRHGDMEVADNQYFEEFRQKLLMDGEGKPLEAANAVHVIKPRQLAAHWPRAIACDWGYSHQTAVGWGCWTPSRQLHLYRELGVKKVGTVELGVRIAEASLEDLKTLPNHHMTMFLSHDAFSRTDEGLSEAELIARGITMVLGENAAFVMAPDETEEILEDKSAWSSVYRRQRQMLNKTNITIVRAQNARKAGWALMHDYLRWWSITPESQVYNEDVGRRILESEGAVAWSEYRKTCEQAASEVLPVLQIWDCCPQMIEGIMTAETNDKDIEDVLKQDGDDFVDMIRYACANFTYQEAVMPRDIHVAETVKLAHEAMPGLSTQSLIMLARQTERAHSQVNRSAVNIPRFAARRRAMINEALTQNGRPN
jgi:hypothetical protein